MSPGPRARSRSASCNRWRARSPSIASRSGWRSSPCPDSPTASKILDAGKADLALLRSDDPTSTEARSIVIVQKRHLFLVARQDRQIKDWADLRNRPVGIVRGDSDDTRPLVERVLNQYGVNAADVRLRETPLQATVNALADGDVDALVFVGFPGQRLRRLLAEITDGRGTQISVIGVSNAGALAFRYRDLEATQLPAGVFSGSPPQPPDNIDTIAITHEIVASSEMNDSLATDLTRTLIEAATRMRRIEDNAFNIEAPPVDRPRRFPAHAGAAAFVNDDAQTFLETYSEYIWLALFGLSILGSSITGVPGLGRAAPGARKHRLHPPRCRNFLRSLSTHAPWRMSTRSSTSSTRW